MKRTRKQRSETLMERLESGPTFTLMGYDAAHLRSKTDKEICDYFADRYRIWAESWIIPDVKRLVPELREKD